MVDLTRQPPVTKSETGPNIIDMIRAAQQRMNELHQVEVERAERGPYRLIVEPHRVDQLRAQARYHGLDRDVEIHGSQFALPGQGLLLPPEQQTEEWPLSPMRHESGWRDDALKDLQDELRRQRRKGPPRAVCIITSVP